MKSKKFENMAKILCEFDGKQVDCIMRYLITTKEVKSPFLTQRFEPENHFNPDVEMMVYDLDKCKFTTDGKVWHDIEIDHL